MGGSRGRRRSGVVHSGSAGGESGREAVVDETKRKRRNGAGDESDERVNARVLSKGTNAGFWQKEMNASGLSNERERRVAKMKAQGGSQRRVRRRCLVSGEHARFILSLTS